MQVKHSITRHLARWLFMIVILSGVSAAAALMTLVDSLNDAEAVNIAGSLRMQSYRLAYETTNNCAQCADYRQQYQRSLDALTQAKLNRFYVPEDVREKYQKLQRMWHELDQSLTHSDRTAYQQQVANYVDQIDDFVLALQRYSELKLTIVAWMSLAGFIIIIFLVIMTLRYIRRQVVYPLNQLVNASQQIQQRNFSILLPRQVLPNELGVLSHAFTSMSGELGKLYESLEQIVREKTEGLTQANETLAVLYECSQALTVSQIDTVALQHILDIVRENQMLTALKVQIKDDNSEWSLESGTPTYTLSWYTLPLRLEDHALGMLRWQSESTQAHPYLMQNVANMLSRGIFSQQMQQQHLQWLLMEERATIARELHDSLAQSLSFLRIQLTLLKRQVPAEYDSAQAIIRDFERALTDAYRQLRELLDTFRLTIQEANIHEALQQLLEPLKTQTQANIEINCTLPSYALNAQQQVHALQIVREAVLNAIKHADATNINIDCVNVNGEENHLIIRDDGIGIAHLDEPAGHYGLTIMSERAVRLGGVLTVQQGKTGGTEVKLVFPT